MKKSERSEEVTDIIERIPNGFGRWVMFIVIFLVSCLMLFGWFIKYPDTIKGQIAINAQHATVKLISNTSGKLLLKEFKQQDKVNEGDYIAVIQNSANTADIVKIMNLLNNFNIDNKSLIDKRNLFPDKVALGEASLKYFIFVNAFMKICNYQDKNTFEKQEENLTNFISEETEMLEQNYKSKRIREEVLTISGKTLQRDSVVRKQFSNNAVSEAEIERSKMNYLTAKDNYQNVNKEITSLQIQINEAKNKLDQLRIEKEDKEKQMRLDLISSYNDLEDNLKQWEQKYVFKAPFDGKVEYLKFWTNNQFIQAGEEVFTIVPKKNTIVGQVQLPANGAGKVKTGCTVIIKLDNYPYMEYGSVKGKVKSVALTPNSYKNTQGNSESYLVQVDLPNELTTNYGTKLEFKYDLKGTADIITNDRRLMQRLFDNLRYTISQ
jgi:multidrug efflux pump subunit AcrA (membrane-fusion protein)